MRRITITNHEDIRTHRSVIAHVGRNAPIEIQPGREATIDIEPGQKLVVSAPGKAKPKPARKAKTPKKAPARKQAKKAKK